MSLGKVLEYSSAIQAIKAEDALLAIQTSNFRAFKKEAKNKIINRLKRNANNLIKKSSGRLPTYQEVMADLRRKLGG